MNRINKVWAGAALFIAAIASTFIPSINRTVIHAQTQITGNGPYVIANFFEGQSTPIGTCNKAYNYGLFFLNDTNDSLWVCSSNGFVEISGSGGGGSGSPVEVTISFGSSVTLSNSAQLQSLTLTGNVTHSTIAPATNGGFCTTININQGQGGPWTFTWPSNMYGVMGLGPGTNSQSFCYDIGFNAWFSNSPGVNNENSGGGSSGFGSGGSGFTQITPAYTPVTAPQPVQEGYMHIQIPFTKINAASTTDYIPIATVPAGFKLRGLTEVETTPLAGPTGLTAATIAFGRGSSDPVSYMQPRLLYQTAGTQHDTGANPQFTGGVNLAHFSPIWGTHVLTAQIANTTASSPSNFGNGTTTTLTAGLIDVYVWYVVAQ